MVTPPVEAVGRDQRAVAAGHADATSGFLFSYARPLLLLFFVVLEDLLRKPGTFVEGPS